MAIIDMTNSMAMMVMPLHPPLAIMSHMVWVLTTGTSDARAAAELARESPCAAMSSKNVVLMLLNDRVLDIKLYSFFFMLLPEPHPAVT